MLRKEYSVTIKNIPNTKDVNAMRMFMQLRLLSLAFCLSSSSFSVSISFKVSSYDSLSKVL